MKAFCLSGVRILKLIIAIDSFKGSLTAQKACEITAQALLAVNPVLVIVLKPMADGGEGTAKAMIAAGNGDWIPAAVTGPLPQMQVNAGFAFFGDSQTALVEMAQASGLELLSPEQMNPLKTTTYGTGQLIAAASVRAKKLLLAVGGSATVDGGVGAAMALGYQFLDKAGSPIEFGGGQLGRIHRIVQPDSLNIPPVEVLCDVDNPLCGPNGAAKTFGPQKGATGEMVAQLEAGLAHLAGIVKDQMGIEIDKVPGAGAAGGLSAGALGFMNAKLVPGIETVIKASGLAEEIAEADWIITGEGRFDEQSLRGKVISGIVNLVTGAKPKIAVLAGSVELPKNEYEKFGIDCALALRKPGMPLDYALSHAEQLLHDRATQFAKAYLANPQQ